MKIRKKISALFLFIGLIFLMNVCAFADEEKTIIDSIDLTITSNIKDGDKINGSQKSISVDAKPEGFKTKIDILNRKEHSNIYDYSIVLNRDTWYISEKPYIKVTLTTEAGYSFPSSSFDLNLTVNGETITYDSNRLFINSKEIEFTYYLPRIDGRDNDDYDLSVSNVSFDSDTGILSWDGSSDANLYAVVLKCPDNGFTNRYYPTTTSLDCSYILKRYKLHHCSFDIRALYDAANYSEYFNTETFTFNGVSDSNTQDSAYYTTSDNTDSFNDSINTDSYDDDSYDDDSYDDTYNDDSFSDINFTSNENTINESNTEVTENSTATNRIIVTAKGTTFEAEWMKIMLDTGKETWTIFCNGHPELTESYEEWYFVHSPNSTTEGTWYYFDNHCLMATGLKEINGALYYFEEQPENQGAMYVNKSYGGYFFGPDGKAVISQ